MLANPFGSWNWLSEKKIWKKNCGRTEKICGETVLPENLVNFSWFGPAKKVSRFLSFYKLNIKVIKKVRSSSQQPSLD